MKIKLIACVIVSSTLVQANPGIDMAKLAETLRLEGTDLKIEDVTKREADARKLPLRSAWIVSAPGHELFFPLVIYTAQKGSLHNEKHTALRNSIRKKPPKEGDFGYGLGFFEVPEIGECFVFMEEIAISSNNPARVKDGIPLPAWRPTSKTILSIIGTLESKDLDFQIAILLLDEDEVEDFPAFKSMLYGPDFPVIKELASAVVNVVRDSNLLAVVDSQQDNRQGIGIVEKRSNPEVKTPGLSGKTPESEEPPENSAVPRPSLFLWLLGVCGLLVALIAARAVFKLISKGSGKDPG